jgi:DNA uptake protein ComE-like DNA-binding protein
LADSVFAQMLPFLRTSNATLPKLDLNRASQYELMRELKISEPIAKAITIFRQQYGPYKSINELRKLVFMTDSLYQLIESQVKVN